MVQSEIKYSGTYHPPTRDLHKSAAAVRNVILNNVRVLYRVPRTCPASDYAPAGIITRQTRRIKALDCPSLHAPHVQPSTYLDLPLFEILTALLLDSLDSSG